MKTARATLVVSVVVIVAGGLWLRSYFSPGKIVTRKVLATVEAIEEERLLGVMAAVSRSYSDQWGNTYESVGGHLNQLMETFEDIDVDLVMGGVEATTDEVRIGLEFVVTARYDGARESVFGSGAQPCAAVLVWRKDAPGWRLASTADLDIPELRDELEARRPR